MSTEARFVKKVGDKWNVYSEDGKVLGTHPTKEEADKQLEAIEAAKHAKESKSYLPSREVRSIETEIRMVDVEGKQMIRGYAAVYNRSSQVMKTPSGREFVERIQPGAFRKALDGGADVRALFNHDPNALLGRRGAGTLQLGEDDHGLWYQIDPPDTTAGRDTVTSLQRGDLTGSSFSFATVEDDWGAGPDGQVVRTLKQAHPFDVGPVVFPAYEDASAAYRSLDGHERQIAAAKVTYPTAEQRQALQRLRLALLS